MPKWLRVILWSAIALLVLLVAAVVALYRLSQHVPEFYQEALAAEPQAQQKASDRMVRRSTALAGEVRKEGRWEARFTSEEINGWLAVDLPRNFPQALPGTLHDPRVRIEPDGLTIACRADEGLASGVITLKADVYLQKENVIAVRIRKVGLGQVPLPANKVLDAMRRAARHAQVQLQGQQVDGDPLALITLPGDEVRGKITEIDKLWLEDGAIYVAGTTRHR